MKPINIVESVITPLDRKNVDTDQIISKEFLKRIERTGFGQYLFYHWRFDENGNKRDDFVMNDPRFDDSRILVAHDNFGCGSSCPSSGQGVKMKRISMMSCGKTPNDFCIDTE